jgi:hypothetical protein
MLPLERDLPIVMSQVQPCKIQDCHNSVAANPVLSHDATLLGDYFLMFQRIIVPSFLAASTAKKNFTFSACRPKKSSPLVACP